MTKLVIEKSITDKLISQNENHGKPPAFVCFIFVFVLSILFRWSVSVGPYSGFSKPPMFGDYEAQRHWMEITFNLPIKDWYFNTTDNDLLYWGLDYPPLTAYHSWLMGCVADKINSSWISLHESRGLETYHHKLFMRYSVLIVDCLLFIPAVYLFVLHFQKPKNLSSQCSFLITWLMYPGFLLVDYGHFQYNCVSLGFFLLSCSAFFARKDYLGSVLFCLALNYKQMELYHALPIFCYLLGSCLQQAFFQGIGKLLKLAIVVVFTFGLLWLPFMTSLESFGQVAHRIFPVARGIYEDKVANVWCSLSVLIKWKNIFSTNQMATLSAFVTLVLLLPSSIMILIRPTKHQLKYALSVSSLVFFLFSFQVHEKSILLASVPILLILNEEPFVCCWFLLTSVVSLFPLAVKDNIQIAFFALLVSYYVWILEFIWSDSSFGSKRSDRPLIMNLFHASFFVGLIVCASSSFITPPEKLPDLHPLLISMISCFCFICFFIFFYYKQFSIFVNWHKQEITKKVIIVVLWLAMVMTIVTYCNSDKKFSI